MNRINCKKTGVLAFFWRFAKLQKGLFFCMLLLSVTQAVDSTMWPYLLRRVIDVMTEYENSRDLAWAALKGISIWAIPLLFFAEFGFRALGFLIARFLPRLESDIRLAMFDHIQQHTPKYFNQHFSGSLAAKIGDMTTQVNLAINQLFWALLPTLIASIFSLFFFYFVNPLFAGIFALLVVCQITLCIFFAGKCTRVEEAHGQLRSALVGRIVDSLTNNFAVNLFFKFRYERSYIGRLQSEEMVKNRQARETVEYLRVALSATYIIASLSINGLMVYLWLNGKISTGQTVQIFDMTWNMFMLLWFASSSIPPMFQAFGIARQALELFDHPKDIVDAPGAGSLKITKGVILFDSVSFNYGKGLLFEKKKVEIKAGEKVGLVGYSGAGKTTFVNLILRFFQVDSGKILIDGVDISEVTLESLRTQVALIPQDPILFHRTLAENICYGKSDATDKEMIAAAKQAHCHDFISKMPEGYETVVGERGTKLSGGERQRIAIARAMLCKSPILMLDEATSALDSVTEGYIQESLEKLMEGRTTLVVAHRLSTLAKMDRILVFDKGKIIEEGTHAQLLKRGGHYKKMWALQAGGFLPDTPI